MIITILNRKQGFVYNRAQHFCNFSIFFFFIERISSIRCRDSLIKSSFSPSTSIPLIRASIIDENFILSHRSSG